MAGLGGGWQNDGDSSSPAVSILVTIAHNDGEQTYTATPSGGTAPYTYNWTVVTTGSNGGSSLAILSGGTTQAVTTNGSQGMMRVDVTDANGAIASAYFSQLTPAA